MFDRLCDELIGAGLGVHAIEMIYKGKVVLHECFDDDKPYPVYSAAKSVTSMAFSLCCDDGLLSPQTHLADLIEDKYKDLFPSGFDKLSFERFLMVFPDPILLLRRGLERRLEVQMQVSDGVEAHASFPMFIPSTKAAGFAVISAQAGRKPLRIALRTDLMLDQAAQEKGTLPRSRISSARREVSAGAIPCLR